MAIKYKSNCRACQISRGNGVVRNRIYNAYFRHEPGDESLADLSKVYKVSVGSLYNHVKKHVQERDRDGVHKATIINKKVADLQAEANKRAEVAIDHSEMAETEAEQTMDEYISQAHQMVRRGEIKITAQSFLTAVRIKLDHESKKKDRQLDVVKTMYRYASNSKGKIDGRVTPGPDQGLNAGETRPSDIHNETPGNAATQWATRVSKEHAAPEDQNQPADVLEQVG